MKSFLNPQIVLRQCKYGLGLFSNKPIKKNAVLIDWRSGPGILMNSKDSYRLERTGNHFTLQVGENSHLVSLHQIEVCDFINHSCEPNAGFGGSMKLIAINEISAGEEITFDYCMSESHKSFFLYCGCGASACRKVITGQDWKIPFLQQKYRGYFSPYLEEKILLIHKNKKAVKNLCSS